jgi:hypothetical protein
VGGRGGGRLICRLGIYGLWCFPRTST